MTSVQTTRPVDVQRIQDYLDDQISEARDLDGLGDLLLKVQTQQSLLQAQLQDAQIDLDRLSEDVQQQATQLRERATTFQTQQAELDKRLQEISYSSTTDEAARSFESRMIKLRRLELATNYLELIEVVDRLRSEAIEFQETDPRTAVRSYTRLNEISASLRAAQAEAEGSASQIVFKVEDAVQAAHSSLEAALIKTLRGTLDKMNWPQKELKLVENVLESWVQAVDLLLELQDASLLTDPMQTKENQARVLLPLQIMAEPLAQRFRFHFYGDKPTNRLDKPEFFLRRIFDFLDYFSQFMIDHLQPILDSRTQQKGVLEEFYADAVSAFITSLLPMVVSKCLSLLPQISSRPQLLSHFMSELMSFDETLRATWNYAPDIDPLKQWKGLTWLILDQHGYFEQWLQVEKDFALKRYKSIRDAPDSSEIDFEGVSPSQTKPTQGTVRVNDLLETITDRYRGLNSFSQKMKFVIGVQISIFDDYHAHLHSSLQAYLVTSHTAGRLLQGQYGKAEVFGEKELRTLCKIFGSAEYLERKMLDWSDDIFFLELWDELQERAQGHSSSNASVGKDLRLDEVAAKTSSSIKRSESVAANDVEGGALFDETALAYRRLKEAAEREISRLLDRNIDEAVKVFGDRGAWASMSTTTSDPRTLSPSAALDQLLEVTKVLLGGLSTIVAGSALRKLVKHYCATLQASIINNVLLARNFSTAGIAQLKRDVMAIEECVDTVSGIRSVARSTLRRLGQALELVSLPIKRLSVTPASKQVDAEDAWGFEEADDAAEKPRTESMSEVVNNDDWSLWDAEKEIFKSNEAARQALGDMGLDLLTEQEARSLLKRRVELLS